MIIYLDTSAWVKLYVQEPGSKELRAYANKAETLAASVVAYPEARATFARLKAQGFSTEAKHQHRLAQLKLDWVNLLRIQLVPPVVRPPGALASDHGYFGSISKRVKKRAIVFAVFERLDMRSRVGSYAVLAMWAAAWWTSNSCSILSVKISWNC